MTSTFLIETGFQEPIVVEDALGNLPGMQIPSDHLESSEISSILGMPIFL